MSNCLPEIPIAMLRQHKDTDKKGKHSSPRNTFKGITLKEYFRICDEVKPNESLRQIKEQSRASFNSSYAETPTFNLQEEERAVRGKFKTEVCQNEHENQLKTNTIIKNAQTDKSSKANAQSLQKAQKGAYLVMKKKEDRKKVFSKINSQSSKEKYEVMNRSTLNSFYQIEQNKKKMLKKLQQEKQRANDLRLSDAFFITKYGSRFNIDCKVSRND